jgi:peptidoglycan/LPS O-acetylase OafA/YrhL
MEKLKYFKSLDAYRGFAALAVVLGHYFSEARGLTNPILIKLFNLGHSGVSFFFVLSGFVITRILLNSTSDKHYFKNFYIRRTLRIFPLYYFALFCFLIFTSYYLKLTFFETLYSFKYHLTYLQNIARTFNWDMLGPQHYWSLAVEEHFYLIWPAIVYFALKRNLNTLVWTSFVFILVTHVLRFLMVLNEFEINVFTFTRLDQLVFGGFIAILESKGFLGKFVKFKLLAIMLLAVLGVGILEVFSYTIIKETFKHTFWGLLFGGVIIWTLNNGNSKFVKRVLENMVFQFFGKISYGIYVWHLLVMNLMDRIYPSKLIPGFFIVFFGTLIFAFTSYKLIEEPFLKLKSKFEFK